MISTFEELLNQLSKELDIELHANEDGACTILISDAYELQIELDETGDKILVAIIVCQVPPGKFRENVLKDALKENDRFASSLVFAFDESANQLLLFNYFPLESLNASSLNDFISILIEQSTLWKQAIDSGRSSPVEMKNEEKPTPLDLK